MALLDKASVEIQQANRRILSLETQLNERSNVEDSMVSFKSEIGKMVAEVGVKNSEGEFNSFAEKISKIHRKFDSELKTLRQVQSAMPKVIFD